MQNSSNHWVWNLRADSLFLNEIENVCNAFDHDFMTMNINFLHPKNLDNLTRN